MFLSHFRRLRHSLTAGAAALALFGSFTAPVFADTTMTYQVQPGDTLLGIAQQFGSNATSIATMNGLSDPNQISIGQDLRIVVPNTSTGVAKVPTNVASETTTSGVNSSNVLSTLQKSWTTTLISVPADAGPPAFTVLPFGLPQPSALVQPSILSAPYYSQFDGSVYAESNCGPTALSMALGALGVNVDQLTLRNDADVQMGSNSPYNGTTWEALAYAAKVNGVSNAGLYNGQSYRTWSVNDLRAELSKGRPVILLVRYWDLPGHSNSSYAGDHYVVALGFDSNGNLVYNDPAYYTNAGAGQKMTPAQLNQAWTNTSVGLVRTAMALYK